VSPLFGRRDDGPRTAADRDAARQERERRRAEREGRAAPEAPPPDDGTGSSHVDGDGGAPFEWDAPGAYDPHVSEPREWHPEQEVVAESFEPAPQAREPELDEAHDVDERDLGEAAPEPERLEREPERLDPEPERLEPEPERFEPEPERFEREPERFEREPERFEPEDEEPRVRRASEPEPDDGRPDPRVQAWQGRPGPGAAGNGDHAAPPPEDASVPAEREREEDPAAAHARANGGEDPQATQPFDPIAAGAATRRTVSLPRPQTDTSEWDAPIGTVRVSRGGGGGGPGRYQAQPGASGYPPYRKLAVKPRRKWLRRIAVILALGLAIAAAVFAFLLFQPKHGSGHGTVVLNVPAGATADQIGDLLAARGVVRSSFFFSLRARLSGDRGNLRSGRYTLKEGMSYGAALTALTTPPKAAPVVNITLPEGPSRREEAAKLRAAGVKGSYLDATRRSSKLDPRDYGAPRSTRSLEGFLYPATYQLRASQATARRLVDRQLEAFKTAFAKVNMREARRRNLSRYDVLIIASMIEREALVARDRRLISAVIYNRLKDDIPLGIDATLRYALNQWSRPLRVSELERNSAFNTRRGRGLPPTPIGNPGLAAMRAAANPANVSYLFYVVKPCGNGAHAFSSTDAKFQQDVQRYNRARARRGGKDPSRC
jgi:peptidoglycan lytic transglycosylase G